MIELLRHEFILNALMAGTIVAILSGLVGFFVIRRGQSFACEALSHVGFAGATLAVLVGVPALIGMVIFTAMAAFGMGALGNRLRGRDVEIGMVLSFVLGLGVLFLSLYTGNSGAAVGVLFGSILSVTRPEVLVTLVASLAATLALGVIFRPLLFASVDPELAEARGVSVRFLSVIFLFLLAVSVSVAVQVVGVLLVFALLIVPAASAELVSNRPGSAILLAVSISLASTWAGLLLAFIGHWPVSFYIVALTSFFYVAARTIRYLRSPNHYRLPAHPGREVITPDE